jgi:DNA-binding NtrC family response regulator
MGLPNPEVLVPVTVLLAVGLDSSLLESQRSVWQSAGYHVTSADSIREGIAQFHKGDFDLVLLSHSIPAESRERLTFLIRASGSRIPVICVSDSSSSCDSFADATIRVGPDNLLQGIENLLAKRADMLTTRAAT